VPGVPRGRHQAYFLHNDECVSNDFSLRKAAGPAAFNSDIHDWKITFAETGMHSNIGQRLKAVEKYLVGEKRSSQITLTA